MGLPFFVTPPEPDVAANLKAVEKTAAEPRTTIRRLRSARGAVGRISRDLRRRIEADQEAPEVPRGSAALNHYLAQRRSPPARRSNGSTAGVEIRRVNLGGRSASEVVMGPDALTASPQEIRRTSPSQGRRLSPLMGGVTYARPVWNEPVRDVLSFERQHPSGAQEDRPSMPPVPESRDFTAGGLDTASEEQLDVDRFWQVRRHLDRMARRRPAPTPPYAEASYGDNSLGPRPASYMAGTSNSRSRLYADQEPPTLATARRSLDEEIQARQSPYTSDPLGRPSLSERVQTLSRLSAGIERSHRLIRQARLDGLGDRDRSLSPDVAAAWETLSTGIAPDPQPPSAGSSFASSSAAAVATSSSSNTDHGSGSTAMTSVGRTEDSLHDCVLSESETSDEDEEDLYELQDFDQNNNGQFWRTYADVVSAQVDRIARQSANYGEPDQLEGMHRIISRLAERDDIPDEWWAEAGLSRTLRREQTG